MTQEQFLDLLPTIYSDTGKPSLMGAAVAGENARPGMDIEDRNPDFPGLRTILAEMGPEATNALQDAGIPGIRYLDQGSRSAGEGSRNFVVFDDNIIDILKKYGIVPGMAAGANALSNYDPSITY